MISFKILNDDIVIDGNGNIELIDGIDEVLQCVDRALTTNLGEFFLSPTHGLDYAIIKRKGYSIDDIKSAVISCILQEERISSVDSVNVEVDDRDRTVDIRFTATIDNEQVAGEVSV